MFTRGEDQGWRCKTEEEEEEESGRGREKGAGQQDFPSLPRRVAGGPPWCAASSSYPMPPCHLDSLQTLRGKKDREAERKRIRGGKKGRRGGEKSLAERDRRALVHLKERGMLAAQSEVEEQAWLFGRGRRIEQRRAENESPPVHNA